jgi:uncharacterized membrane protein (UPF0136 family)
MGSLIVFMFGLYSLIGGVIGYLKAGSVASLIAGGLSGLVLLACSYGIRKNVKIASIVAFFTALMLGIRFTGTYLQNHRLAPDLTMVILSVGTLLILLLSFFQKKSR